MFWLKSMQKKVKVETLGWREKKGKISSISTRNPNMWKQSSKGESKEDLGSVSSTESYNPSGMIIIQINMYLLHS